MLTLPETIERDYMVFTRRTMDAVAHLADTALLRPVLRTDADDHPDLLELLALLGISMTAVLNQAALRKRLRTVASRLTAEKQAELVRLLGRWVPRPGGTVTEAWIEEQANAITFAVEGWLAEASTIVEETPGSLQEIRAAVAEAGRQAAARAALAASAALLGLNALLAEEGAVGAGLTHYKWVTQGDADVRSHHAKLDGTIQAWASPPTGGACSETYPGHPGTCDNCRCIAQPIVA
jgi:hypothetical protein